MAERSERLVAIFDADGRRLNLGLDRMEKRVGGFKRTLTRAFAGLRNVAGVGGLGALIGGSLGGLNIAGEVFNFESSLTRLGVAADGAFGPLAGLRDQFGSISHETGVNRDNIMQATQAYVALTGDAKGAARQMELFARVQVASGAAMNDIATSSAAMSQNLGIGANEMEKAFSILIAGGKAGAIELKDVAGLLASLAPLAARFAGGSGVAGLVDLSSALQLTRQGFGSASEAATGLESLLGAIVKNAGRLEKAGIKVFDKDARTGVKTMRGLMEIVNAIADSKLAKDPTLLIHALGRKEAEQAFIQLVKNRGAWEALADKTRSATDVARDYETVQQSATARISKAWNDIKLQIAEALTPERIQMFATAIGGLVEVVRELGVFLGAVFETIGDIADLAKSTFFETKIPDMAVDKALKAGKTLEEIAGGEGVMADVARKRIEKRDRPRREIEKNVDAAVNAGGGAPSMGAGGGGQIDMQAESDRFQQFHDRPAGWGVSRQGFAVKVWMDPSTTDLKGKIENHRSQRQ